MFDFTKAMERLVRHIAANCPELAHLEPERILIACMQARSPGVHGIYASVRPLRFEGGKTTMKRRGRTYAMPEVIHDGREILYIIHFALPRFANLSFEDKLTTVFHELYHISPNFNGDVRRLSGRKYVHGHSRKRYNERVRALATNYLTKPGAEERAAFLRPSFDELARQYGGVTGTQVRPPKPKPI